MIAGSLGVILGLAVTLVVVQTPAMASYSNCPAGAGCVYTSALGQGQQGVIPFSEFSGGTCHVIRAPFTNDVESAKADYGSGHYLLFYVDSRCMDAPSPNKVGPKGTLTFGPGNVGLESFRLI